MGNSLDKPLEQIPMVKAIYNEENDSLLFYVDDNQITEWACNDCDPDAMLDDFVEIILTGMHLAGGSIACIGRVGVINK